MIKRYAILIDIKVDDDYDEDNSFEDEEILNALADALEFYNLDCEDIEDANVRSVKNADEIQLN